MNLQFLSFFFCILFIFRKLNYLLTHWLCQQLLRRSRKRLNRKNLNPDGKLTFWICVFWERKECTTKLQASPARLMFFLGLRWHSEFRSLEIQLQFLHSNKIVLEFWCSEYFKCLESWYSEFGCLESTHSEFEWLEFPHSELIWILCVLHARISVLFIFSGYGKMSQNVWKRTTWNLLPALNTRYFHNVKIVHLANHNTHRNSNEPIKFWSKYL